MKYQENQEYSKAIVKFRIHAWAIGILQAYLRNSVYEDFNNSFTNTVGFFEYCYRKPDVETGDSMITF